MGATYSMDRTDCFEYVIENSYIPALVGAYVGFARQHNQGYDVAPGLSKMSANMSQFRTMLAPMLLYGGVTASYLAIECTLEHMREKRNWKTPAMAGAITGYLVGGWKGYPQVMGYPLLGAAAALTWYAASEKIPFIRETSYQKTYGTMPHMPFLEDPEPERPPAKKPHAPFIFKNKTIVPLD